MFETRLAQMGETTQLKELWRSCFGDPDSYIDFYYANRYREEETGILLIDEEIIAMLTMMPVRMVYQDNHSVNTAMLYAIGTHPKYQNKGIATQLMDFSREYLKMKNYGLSILVPAKSELFDFYRRRGYKDGFYIREILLTKDKVNSLPIKKNCKISATTPKKYNQIRNNQLNGRLHISYNDDDIDYQKKLSQFSGADIYALNVEGSEGCIAVERISSEKVLIKEFLLPDEFLNSAISQILQQFNAMEYILRTPAYLGEQLGGSLRLFGLIKDNSGFELDIAKNDLGYLGLAFD